MSAMCRIKDGALSGLMPDDGRNMRLHPMLGD